MTGTLFIVATPIGNLGDITYRAVEVLKNADVIAAEDTRHSKKLLQHYDISTPLVSCHQHTDPAKIIVRLQNGEDVALISDAGTPGISDPGGRLIAACRTAAIPVSPIPGPAALITALCACGLPFDRFVFYGFLPQKKGRQTFYRELGESEMTSVFYESTHRITKCAAELAEALPEREVVFARELTKQYEEFLRGKPAQIVQLFAEHPEKTKGEFVVIVAGKGFKE